MKATSRLICLSIALGTSTAFGADLRAVVAHPGKYNERRVDLVGIARVPDSFFLFADIEAAAKTDLSKALRVRQNNFGGKHYREADRQWVRVAGVMSSEPRRGWDPGTGVLLKRTTTAGSSASSNQGCDSSRSLSECHRQIFGHRLASALRSGPNDVLSRPARDRQNYN
jgi:hypothetical protein